MEARVPSYCKFYCPHGTWDIIDSPYGISNYRKTDDYSRGCDLAHLLFQSTMTIDRYRSKKQGIQAIPTFTVLMVLGTLLTVHTVYQITGKPMIIHGAVTLHTFLSDLPRLSQGSKLLQLLLSSRYLGLY